MPARPIRRVLVCPQEFKGSLDAFEATDAITRGVQQALPGVEAIRQPMADGGPGTGRILAGALEARGHHVRVRGAYGGQVDAPFALADTAEGLLAVVESASAVGLVLTPPEQRDPARSSTDGVGELLHAAHAAGARRAVLCVGGTATMDGGAGVARALGLRLLDATGRDLPSGGLHLARLARVEVGTDVPADLEVRVAVDARNPLAGPTGAVAVYGAQKGLPDWQAPALDVAISRWARLVRAHLGREVDVPGAGTGGGVTAGVLAALPRATLESGAALVAEAVGLGGLIASVDLVVTGEGSLDAQTGYGKTVAHVAGLAAAARVPCVAVAGVVRERPATVADAEPLVEDASDVGAMDAAMRDAAGQVARAAARLVARTAASADSGGGAHHGV